MRSVSSVLFPSLTTKFPVSKSCATGLIYLTNAEVVDDQITESPQQESCRNPSLVTLRMPDVLDNGNSLFTTQTTLIVDVFLNHIPK
ncbi:hypothetical protein L6452_11828 [Arctium lappa]|uniref:Uncharacterized protein n=1 Tax=Arctium lappa TaxID=4217 RepID=A0ACB9DQQ9_ARCLA|nr:hypothetical protein L6452_11828 [Arctium lappa]